MKTVEQIWEGGNKEEILACKEHLKNCSDSRYRIVHRQPESLERYFRHHSNIPDEKCLYFCWHELRYEWDGYVYLLEEIKEKI